MIPRPAFLVLVSLWFLGGAEITAQQSRSVDQGGGIVNLAVKNNARQNVSVVWVNFQGQMESYGSLAAGQTIVLETYAGHLWKFGAGNQLFGEYRATAASRQMYGVNPPAAKPPKVNPPRPPVSPPTGGNPAPVNPPATTGSKVTAAEAQQIIAFHNKARAEVGVPGMTWSAEIAAFAQQWADHLARTGKFEHRPREQQKYGENLAAAQTVMAGMNLWYGEKKLYPAGSAFTM